MKTSPTWTSSRPAVRTRRITTPSFGPRLVALLYWPALAGEISVRLDRLGACVVLFRLGDLIVVTFGCLAGIGTLLSVGLTGVILTGQGVPAAVFMRFALLSTAAVVLGSWLVAQILDWRLVVAEPRRMLRRPVFVSWGGLAGMLVVLVVLAPLSHLPALLLLDAAARALPLGHALGRLGCLSYGCCFGRPTHGPLAIRYRNPEAKAVRVAGLRDVPLHPAALYEAMLDLGIMALVNGLCVLGMPLGTPFALTVLLYGTGRFVIESLRDNRDSAVLPALSFLRAGRSIFPLSRWLCVGLVVLGAALLPGLLQHPQWVPAVHWQGVATGFPVLLPASVLPAFLVFGGFGVHRRRVGEW